MIISGNVIAHKVLRDSAEIDDNVSVQLPSIDPITGELKGAGIMGTIDMPVSGQIGSMTTTINMRSVNKNAAELARPGLHNIELRFVQDVVNASGQLIPQGTKIYITGVTKKYDPGKIEPPTTMDGSVELETLRYRQVIDGIEVLLIDKRNYIYKVNGVDYMQSIRSALG
ncbi:phage major tail tube protein [Desulfitobacterium hafniense]|uniref:phage major tail tube protein n=1 Tax=Desulfitobacterium hafniense TaxID=49338 RepID=UPI000680CFD1|nr:phage major tail tube protein [Desulfitobacterium hafniense]